MKTPSLLGHKALPSVDSYLIAPSRQAGKQAGWQASFIEPLTTDQEGKLS
jgi:hypothetical protein